MNYDLPDVVKVEVDGPVRIVRLGRSAPVLQLSLVTRKADDDNRPIAAVRDAMLSALMSAEQRRSR